MWKLNKQPRAATPAEVAKQRLGLKPVTPSATKMQKAQARARVLCDKALALFKPSRSPKVKAREHPSMGSASRLGPKVTVSLVRRERKMAASK